MRDFSVEEVLLNVEVHVLAVAVPAQMHPHTINSSCVLALCILYIHKTFAIEIPRLAHTHTYTKYSHYSYTRIDDKVTLYIHTHTRYIYTIHTHTTDTRTMHVAQCMAEERERGHGVAQQSALEKVVVHNCSYLLSKVR